jgi:hypothetical protein
VQTFPQAPQFVVVFSGVQVPLQQPLPAAQAWAQAPQLFTSVCSFTHAVPQRV